MNKIWQLRPAETGFVLDCGTKQFSCLIGKNGLIAAQQKKEGDEATPIGQWQLRCLYYRPDRTDRNQLPARLPFPVRALRPDDGWCDDASSGLYNYPVHLPFAKSHETLWRKDGLYDLILPLGYNDGPVTPHRGSAIFLHCAETDTPSTEGCVALQKSDLLMILPFCTSSTLVTVQKQTES